MKPPFLPQDKANHVVYGAVIALVAYAGLLAIGTPHGVELMDAVATLAGGGLVAAAALLPAWIG